MGEVISLDAYRESNVLEEDYQKFLTHVNKFNGIPTTTADLARTFYFILRYLEGTVNCFSILSLLHPMPEKEMYEMKQMVLDYINGIKSDLETL